MDLNSIIKALESYSSTNSNPSIDNHQPAPHSSLQPLERALLTEHQIRSRDIENLSHQVEFWSTEGKVLTGEYNPKDAKAFNFENKTFLELDKIIKQKRQRLDQLEIARVALQSIVQRWVEWLTFRSSCRSFSSRSLGERALEMVRDGGKRWHSQQASSSYRAYSAIGSLNTDEVQNSQLPETIGKRGCCQRVTSGFTLICSCSSWLLFRFYIGSLTRKAVPILKVTTTSNILWYSFRARREGVTLEHESFHLNSSTHSLITPFSLFTAPMTLMWCSPHYLQVLLPSLGSLRTSTLRLQTQIDQSQLWIEMTLNLKLGRLQRRWENL